MQITGIILSGGKSTRMGTDKALLVLGKNNLLENAIEKCASVCSEILISSDHADHAKFGYRTIRDEFKNCGPLSGIYSCLRQSENDWNFVLSVDAAFVEKEFIEVLFENTGSFDAVVPIHNNGKEPLIALFHKKCIPAMLQQLQSGDFKMHTFLNHVNTRFVDTQSWIERNPRIFHNINRPDDIQFV